MARDERAHGFAPRPHAQLSWPTTLPWFGIPIDHVAVNTGFDILSHRRLPNFESDHYGVLVELALRAERNGGQP